MEFTRSAAIVFELNFNLNFKIYANKNEDRFLNFSHFEGLVIVGSDINELF